jgi:hypothetical protein
MSAKSSFTSPVSLLGVPFFRGILFRFLFPLFS